jgi:hypothetical protein
VGAQLKKLRRAEGGAKIFGVFRVKNHDFTPKNHIFPILGGGVRNFWVISCEKSRFYAKKIIFLPILGGGRAGCAPPLNPPLGVYIQLFVGITLTIIIFSKNETLTIFYTFIIYIYLSHQVNKHIHN